MWNNTTDGTSADRLDSPVNTYTVLTICYYVMGGVGFTGNLLVVIVMLNTKNIRNKVSGLYVINLAIVDMLTAIMLIITTSLPDDGRVYSTLADEIYCRLWLLRIPLWIFIHTSAWSLVALTIERFLAVVYPIKHKIAFTRGKALIFLGLAWAIPWVYMLVNFLATSHTEESRCVVYVFASTAAQRASGVMTALLNYFIPLAILAFCYLRMVYALRRKVAPTSDTPTEDMTARHGQQLVVQRNVIRTLIIVCLAFILCASWIQWFFFLFNVGVFDYATYNNNVQFRLIATATSFANCCVNPFIYTAKYKAFQVGLRKTFCFWRTKIASGGMSATESTNTN